MEKKDIASYSFEELQEEMLAIGEKGFRSRQIYSWIHEKLVDDFEEMTNLPKTLRQKLEAAYEIRRVEMEKRQISKIDGTNKFLFCLKDGNMAIRYAYPRRLAAGWDAVSVHQHWTGWNET